MRTVDFKFDLPPELVAQFPTPERDASRLLVFRRESVQLEHRKFRDLRELMRPGDVMVLNDSRVVPARLRGRSESTGGAIEVLLVGECATNDWWTMMRPGKRGRVGTRIRFAPKPSATDACIGANPKMDPSGAGMPAELHAMVTATNSDGHRRVRFEGTTDILKALDVFGEVPLPPYITRDVSASTAADKERYQTVYARADGSIAAPTAGLHFTNALLAELCASGVRVCYITLHVGLGTFAPVKSATLEAHVMHEERYEVSKDTADEVNAAKSDGRRVLAVGTTSLRVLESVAAAHNGMLVAGQGSTRIFVHPPFNFQVVNALLTNFHLPCSTLLMLVSAFAAPGKVQGREHVLSAYAEAIARRYRFFSYGDAMLLL